MSVPAGGERVPAERSGCFRRDGCLLPPPTDRAPTSPLRARNATGAPEVMAQVCDDTEALLRGLEEDIDELAAAAEAQKTKDKELGRSRSTKMPNCGNSGATYDLREGVLVQGLEIKGSSACTAAFDEDDDGTSYLTLTVRARAPASHARASHA